MAIELYGVPGVLNLERCYVIWKTQKMIPLWTLWAMTVLSTWQIGESIRHGSIFESFRARVESWRAPWPDWIQCGFCFSHASAAAATMLTVGHVLLATRYSWTFNVFTAALVWLSAIRAANTLNDVFKPWSRTPSRDTLPELKL